MKIVLSAIVIHAIYQTALSLTSAPQPVHTLLLCRHGDSIWNGGQPGTQETFTGWTDVPLSQKGITEARNTAEELALYSHGIDACFTSILGRAKETAHYCCWAFAEKPFFTEPKKYVSDYRLNERHYGALQGYIKSHVEQGLHGHDYKSVQEWRRSWYAVPPLLTGDDPRRIKEVQQFANYCGGIENVPYGESLEMVANNRIRPFLDNVLHPIMSEAAESKQMQSLNGDGDRNNIGGCGLVVAHANSLRALIGVICQVEKDEVALKRLEAMKIQTGVPLVLKYKQLEDGSYQACDLTEVGSISNQVGSPDLPVWPLSCIPKNQRMGQSHVHYSRSTETEKKLGKRQGALKIRIDVI